MRPSDYPIQGQITHIQFNRSVSDKDGPGSEIVSKGKPKTEGIVVQRDLALTFDH